MWFQGSEWKISANGNVANEAETGRLSDFFEFLLAVLYECESR